MLNDTMHQVIYESINLFYNKKNNSNQYKIVPMSDISSVLHAGLKELNCKLQKPCQSTKNKFLTDLRTSR